MPVTIEPGVVVTFHYVLKNAAGEVLDDSAAREQPMVCLHGANNVVRGLEQAMGDRLVGERFTVEVPPHLAYGLRQGGPQPIPRRFLPDDADLTPGASFATRTPEGRPMVLWIHHVEGDEVWVDPHHPLAGQTLTYDIHVVSLRLATAAEKAAGHPLDA